MTQQKCWKHGHGPCFGKVVRYQPFGSSGKFLYCQAHREADEQIAARAGTPGWCWCGRPVITKEIVAYRKGLAYRLNEQACIIHQPKPTSDEEMEARHRYLSEQDNVAALRDFERDTGYIPS